MASTFVEFLEALIPKKNLYTFSKHETTFTFRESKDYSVEFINCSNISHAIFLDKFNIYDPQSKEPILYFEDHGDAGYNKKCDCVLVNHVDKILFFLEFSKKNKGCAELVKQFAGGQAFMKYLKAIFKYFKEHDFDINQYKEVRIFVGINQKGKITPFSSDGNYLHAPALSIDQDKHSINLSKTIQAYKFHAPK